MDKRILKFVAQNLKSNYTHHVNDYAKYTLVDFDIPANDEMLTWLRELGYVGFTNPIIYVFTEKALKILHEEV